MRAQLRKLDTIVAQQRRNWLFVKERIQELRGWKLRQSHDPDGDIGWTLNLIFADKEMRNKFVAAMTAENVAMAAPSAATPLPPFPYIENKCVPHPAWPTFNTPRGPGNPYGAASCPRTLDIFNRAATLTIGPKYHANRSEGYRRGDSEGAWRFAGLSKAGTRSRYAVAMARISTIRVGSVRRRCRGRFRSGSDCLAVRCGAGVVNGPAATSRRDHVHRRGARLRAFRPQSGPDRRSLGGYHSLHRLRRGATGHCRRAKVCLSAAIIMMAFCVLRLGRHISRVPQPVVVGFSCGIGSMMVISQLPAMFALRPGKAGWDPNHVRAIIRSYRGESEMRDSSRPCWRSW